MAKKYDASDIVVLEGIEPVRRRPAMYIGGTDKTGLHHLVWEILDNAIDEVINGHATTIVVELDKARNGIHITDNGRGIPVEKHPKFKKSALEIIMTTLHAGGKFETGSYIHSGGTSWSWRIRRECLISPSRSQGQTRWTGMEPNLPSREKPKVQSNESGKPVVQGTSVYFKPDASIFGKTTLFDPVLLRDTLELKPTSIRDSS